jgi:hypothetical protein
MKEKAVKAKVMLLMEEGNRTEAAITTNAPIKGSLS